MDKRPFPGRLGLVIADGSANGSKDESITPKALPVAEPRGPTEGRSPVIAATPAGVDIPALAGPVLGEGDDFGPLDFGPLDFGPLDFGPLDFGPLELGPEDEGFPDLSLLLEVSLFEGLLSARTGAHDIATTKTIVMVRRAHRMLTLDTNIADTNAGVNGSCPPAQVPTIATRS